MVGESTVTPQYAPFFGVMGVSSAIVFSALGAAYGTAKSGTGIASMAVMRPELIMKSIIPVVMAGIIAIYGLVVAVLLAGGLDPKTYSLFQGFIQLGAGLSVGFSGLAAGFAIGIVGDAGVRGTAQQPRLFVGMILILIFAEVLEHCGRYEYESPVYGRGPYGSLTAVKPTFIVLFIFILIEKRYFIFEQPSQID